VFMDHGQIFATMQTIRAVDDFKTRLQEVSKDSTLQIFFKDQNLVLFLYSTVVFECYVDY